MGEQVSGAQIDALNDSPPEQKSRTRDSRVDPSFRKYLNEKLGHLSTEERAVIEPVLIKYRSVFYEEGTNEFKGTDLVEHRIDTGDARPIRKPQIECHTRCATK
jgi:hypothetical protein